MTGSVKGSEGGSWPTGMERSYVGNTGGGRSSSAVRAKISDKSWKTLKVKPRQFRIRTSAESSEGVAGRCGEVRSGTERYRGKLYRSLRSTVSLSKRPTRSTMSLLRLSRFVSIGPPPFPYAAHGNQLSDAKSATAKHARSYSSYSSSRGATHEPCFIIARKQQEREEQRRILSELGLRVFVNYLFSFSR